MGPTSTAVFFWNTKFKWYMNMAVVISNGHISLKNKRLGPYFAAHI
jgi:hypothetical protein